MVSQRARAVQISGIRRMFESAPPDAVNLGLGEPDFDPPEKAVEAVCDALRNGSNHYGPTAGLPALREAVATQYRDRRASTAAENVIITSGGSEGLLATALALYDVGDEILVPDPGFVLYGPHARLAGALPVAYPLAESRGFLPEVEKLERRVSPQTRVLVVNSPCNPTGAVYPRALVERLLAFAEEHDLTIVSDEVYDRIVFDGSAASFWGKSERVVVVNSFSKTLAATGWRIGFLVAPAELAVEINKIHYHIVACPSTPAQVGVLAGISDGMASTRAMVREFRARREIVMQELAKAPGITCVRPSGAFYAFPRFSWPKSSGEVAGSLAQRGVITTPGDAFGPLGAGHLRLSFAASRENLRRGLGILREYAELASAA